MSFQFEPFRNQWLTFTDILDPFAEQIEYTIDLHEDFFSSLSFDAESLFNYRVQAARSAAQQLGDDPVLCFSGGADSQAMIQCWREANLKFDVAILEFDNELNKQDTEIAMLYCKEYNITPKIIKLNIVQFLTRDSTALAERYKCTSPHFSTHYKMFDMLREMGYTGICCGGTALAKNHTEWGPAPSAAQANYIEYSRQHQFPVIGNFLGYDPALCWTIALLTPEHNVDWTINYTRPVEDINLARYTAKVIGYRNHGLAIIPQENKYTGFELVKEYFAEKFNDGWAFEKMFRIPLQKKYGTAKGVLIVSESQANTLSNIYSKNFRTS